MESNFWSNMFRAISVMIDGLAYRIFKLLYELFWEISTTTILETGVIKAFASRVYVLVGIVMLFKLAFSLVNMFVNPDSFSDESKGFGKLVQRSLLALAMLVLVPFVFSAATRLQGTIVESNIIGNLILGKSSTEKINDENAGDKVTVSIYRSFLSGGALTADSPLEDYLLSITQINDAPGGIYTYNYQMFVSCLAGVFGIIIMLNFVLDISIRAIKLAFLQLIAPVPIIMYVDPKGAEGAFSKYITTCMKTYAGLFIRIASLYFTVFIIFELTKGEGLITLYNAGCDSTVDNCAHEVNNWLVQPLIILGLFNFAKEIPKMLEDILGIKFDGEFSFNPFKRYKDALAPAAALVGGGIGLAAGGSNFVRTLTQGGNIGDAAKNATDGYRNHTFGTPEDVENRNNRRNARHQLNQEQKTRALAAKVKANPSNYYSDKYAASMANVKNKEGDLDSAKDEAQKSSMLNSSAKTDAEARVTAARERMGKSQDNLRAMQQMSDEDKSKMGDANYKKNLATAEQNVLDDKAACTAAEANRDAVTEKAIADANASRKAVEDAEKALEGAKADHEVVRKSDPKGRKAEDAVKFADHHPAP